MALREGLDHQGQVEKPEPQELLEGKEREGSMDKTGLQDVGVRKERKVNSENRTSTAVCSDFQTQFNDIKLSLDLKYSVIFLFLARF